MGSQPLCLQPQVFLSSSLDMYSTYKFPEHHGFVVQYYFSSVSYYSIHTLSLLTDPQTQMRCTLNVGKLDATTRKSSQRRQTQLRMYVHVRGLQYSEVNTINGLCVKKSISSFLFSHIHCRLVTAHCRIMYFTPIPCGNILHWTKFIEWILNAGCQITPSFPRFYGLSMRDQATSSLTAVNVGVVKVDYKTLKPEEIYTTQNKA